MTALNPGYLGILTKEQLEAFTIATVSTCGVTGPTGPAGSDGAAGATGAAGPGSTGSIGFAQLSDGAGGFTTGGFFDAMTGSHCNLGDDVFITNTNGDGIILRSNDSLEFVNQNSQFKLVPVGAIEVDGPVGPASSEGDVNITGNFKINGVAQIGSGTPASASATGVAGQIRMDAGFAYFCVATNTWVRAVIATWV